MSRQTVGLILGGVGVVALGSFTYFALSGKAKHSDLEESCAPNCAEADADEVSRSYLIADLSLLAAAASLGVGAYFFLTPETSEAKPHQSTGVTLNVAGRF